MKYNQLGLPAAPDPLLGYDSRRMQSIDARGNVSWIKSLTQMVSTHLSRYNLMTTTSGESKRLVRVHALKSTVNEGYVESETEHQDGDQDRHVDEPPLFMARFMAGAGRADADMPLSVLVALDAGAKLRVWPRGGGPPMLIRLDLGEVLVFRGDLCHAGLGYRVENVRVHMYLYHPAYRPGPSQIHACQPV